MSDIARRDFLDMVAATNSGPLRNRSTACEQAMFDFGPQKQFLYVKLGKIWLDEPPFAAASLAAIAYYSR